MKRIILALIALSFSATSVMAEDIDGYASVLLDQVSPSSSYPAPETWIENHGSVLLDKVADNRGVYSESHICNNEIFNTDAGS